MVLPELSRTTRNTVNRVARNELHSNPVVLERSIKGEINLYIDLQEHRLDQIVKEKLT